MKLAIVTDEISLDFEEAVHLGVDMGLHDFELRNLISPTRGEVVRCAALAEADLPHISLVLQRYSARLIGISPGLFKVRLSDPAFAAHCTELQERSLELALALNVPQVIVFSPVREEGEPGDTPCPDAGCAALVRAAGEAGQRGLTLLLENEPICYADTGVRTAALLRRLGQPALRANWDPANAAASGEQSYPDGYIPLRPWVSEVHVKDGRLCPDGVYQFSVLGEGKLDWPRQLHALAEDGYKGYLTVETHLEPRVPSSRASVAALREMVAPLCGEHCCI
jgi:sugar phosphate isomerase/epimerase